MEHVRSTFEAARRAAQRRASAGGQVFGFPRQHRELPRLDQSSRAQNTGQRLPADVRAGFGNARVTLPELISAIKDTLLEDRSRELEEPEILAKLAQLDDEINHVHRRIFHVAHRIGQIKHIGTTSARYEAPLLREEITIMQDERSCLQEQKKQLNQRLCAGYDKKDQDDASLLADLDDLFVRRDILPPRGEARVLTRDRAPFLKPTKAIKPEQHTEAGRVAEAIMGVPSGSQYFEKRSERSMWQKLRSYHPQNALYASPTPPLPLRNVADGVRDLLERIYHSRKLFLREAERALDTRAERFDEERRDYWRSCMNGEVVELSIELDMRQLLETRRLTRELADAEASFYQAKAEAVAGGVHLPGSDAESGSVNDFDDDYRLSLEEGEVDFVDMARIRQWLANVSDKPLESSPWEHPRVLYPASYRPPRDAVEVDSWDAKTVDICDSVSMRADGGRRRW